VTGDETWVSFLNIETKERSKQSMHTFIKEAKTGSLPVVEFKQH
jgi:hypothetical protein